MGGVNAGKSSLLSILAGQLSYKPSNYKELGGANRLQSVSSSASPSPHHTNTSFTTTVNTGRTNTTLSDSSLQDTPSVGIKGNVWYNSKPLRTDYFQRKAELGEVSEKPWERCGFVECFDLFHMDLTVQDVITYAMKV